MTVYQLFRIDRCQLFLKAALRRQNMAVATLQDRSAVVRGNGSQ
jgi:hypothetical protein